MAKVCAITKKGSIMAGSYSNRVRATKFNPIPKSRKYPNLQRKSILIPELGKRMTIDVSAAGLKTIKKKGAFQAFKDAGLIK